MLGNGRSNLLFFRTSSFFSALPLSRVKTGRPLRRKKKLNIRVRSTWCKSITLLKGPIFRRVRNKATVRAAPCACPWHRRQQTEPEERVPKVLPQRNERQIPPPPGDVPLKMKRGPEWSWPHRQRH